MLNTHLSQQASKACAIGEENVLILVFSQLIQKA